MSAPQGDGAAVVPAPWHGYEFTPSLLRDAVSHARVAGWHVVARRAGRALARRDSSLARAAAIEASGATYTPGTHYGAAEAQESAWALQDYAARVVALDTALTTR